MKNRVTLNNFNHILNNSASVDVSMNRDSITVGCTTVTMDAIKFLLEKHTLHFPEPDKEVKIQTIAQTQLQGVGGMDLAAQAKGVHYK